MIRQLAIKSIDLEKFNTFTETHGIVNPVLKENIYTDVVLLQVELDQEQFAVLKLSIECLPLTIKEIYKGLIEAQVVMPHGGLWYNSNVLLRLKEADASMKTVLHDAMMDDLPREETLLKAKSLDNYISSTRVTNITDKNGNTINVTVEKPFSFRYTNSMTEILDGWQ